MREIILLPSKVKYDQWDKNNTVLTYCMWKWVMRVYFSRTFLMSVFVESARLGLVEDHWKTWSNVIKGRALYQTVIPTLLNLFRAQCA